MAGPQIITNFWMTTTVRSNCLEHVDTFSIKYGGEVQAVPLFPDIMYSINLSFLFQC